MTRQVRAAVYARVSTLKEAQDTSIAAQLPVCRDYCARQGWAVVAEESDRRSGRSEDRPGWQRVLTAARSGLIDKLVVDKRDRVWRNLDDFRAAKRSWMREWAVEIVPVQGIRVEPGNIWTEFAEEDEFIAAERFSRRLGAVTREGMRRRQRDGFWTAPPPAGTVRGAKRGVPEPGKAWEVIPELFRRAADGQRGRALLGWLATTDLRPARGGRWGATTLARILASPFYLGEWEVDGERVELRHQCRVDRATWLAAQAEMPGGERGGRPAGLSCIFLLPRVRCGHYALAYPAKRAGEPLPVYPRWAVGRGGVVYPYYRRADRLRWSGGVEAASADGTPLRGPDSLRAGIDAAELEALVVPAFAHWCAGQGVLDLRIDAAAEEATARAASEAADLRRRRGQLRGKVARLEQAVLDNVAEAGLREVLFTIEKGLAEARAELARVEGALRTAEAEAALVGPRIERLRARGRSLSGVGELWRRGERAALRDLLELAVEYVDLRVRGESTVALRDWCANHTVSSPNGNRTRVFALRGRRPDR